MKYFTVEQKAQLRANIAAAKAKNNYEFPGVEIFLDEFMVEDDVDLTVSPLPVWIYSNGKESLAESRRLRGSTPSEWLWDVNAWIAYARRDNPGKTVHFALYMPPFLFPSKEHSDFSCSRRFTMRFACAAL